MENLPYDIFWMKNPEYVMNIIDTYGGFTVKEDHNISNRIFNVGDEDRSLYLKYTKNIWIIFTLNIWLTITTI